MTPQQKRIVELLESGSVLRRTETFRRLGIVEAPARISELRAMGYDIRTRRITVKNRYGESVSIAEWYMPRVVELEGAA